LFAGRESPAVFVSVRCQRRMDFYVRGRGALRTRTA